MSDAAAMRGTARRVALGGYVATAVLLAIALITLTRPGLWVVIAAIVTPPDAISQLMLAIPLCLLYELGLLMARFVAKRPERPAADDQASA